VEYGFLMEKNTGSKPQFLNSEYKNTHMKKKRKLFHFPAKYLSWLQQTSYILQNILHNSHCTHQNALHLIRWLHPKRKSSI